MLSRIQFHVPQFKFQPTTFEFFMFSEGFRFSLSTNSEFFKKYSTIKLPSHKFSQMEYAFFWYMSSVYIGCDDNRKNINTTNLFRAECFNNNSVNLIYFRIIYIYYYS